MYNLLVMQINLYACVKQLQLKHEGQDLVPMHACLKQLQLKHEVQNLNNYNLSMKCKT